MLMTKKFFHRGVLFSALLAMLLAFPNAAGAFESKAWQARLAERTATLWVEGQFLGDLVLNARGELKVTWLERALSRVHSSDRDVDEWVAEALGYYFSRREEIKAKMKGRDVFVLTYKALKNWSFDPCKLTVNGYAITPEDILTRKEYWERDVRPGYVGTLAVAAPSVEPGQTAELRYEDAAASIKTPRRAR